MTNSAVSSISTESTQWVGEWSTTYTGVWLDYALLLVNVFSRTLSGFPKIVILAKYVYTYQVLFSGNQGRNSCNDLPALYTIRHTFTRPFRLLTRLPITYAYFPPLQLDWLHQVLSIFTVRLVGTTEINYCKME